MPWLIFGITALALTWPLIGQVGLAIPLGSETTPTVPLFNLWTMGWNAEKAADLWRGYWQAPIFYPAEGAFAFSDPQPLTGLLAAPLWKLRPALTYNLTLLLFITLNGWAGYRLARWRKFDQLSALATGLLIQMLPFLTQERGVLQLQPVFGMLWALIAIWELAHRPRAAAAWQVTLGLLVTFLTSEYYGVFTLILLLPIGLLGIKNWSLLDWRWPMLAAGLFAVVILPVLLPQQIALRKGGFSRSRQTITANSAVMEDYFHAPKGVLAENLIKDEWAGQRLFPGVGLLGLAVLGVLGGVQDDRQKKFVLELVLLSGMALVFSFGYHLQIGKWMPYSLFEKVPGFSNLRSPFRWAGWFQIGVALLSGFGLYTAQSSSSLKRWLIWLLLAAALLENFPLPGQMVEPPKLLPPEQFSTPAIFLPLPAGNTAADFAPTVEWMLQSLPAEAVLLNGYSGYFPDIHSQLRSALEHFPTIRGLRMLRALGVKTIILKQDWLAQQNPTVLVDAIAQSDLRRAGQLDGLVFFQLTGSAFQSIGTFDGRWAVRAGIYNGQLQISAYPVIFDRQVYIFSSGRAALHWKITLEDESGQKTDFLVSPPGSAIFLHGGDAWITLDIPLPETKSRYRIQLVDTDTGQQIGVTEFKR